MRTKRSSYRRTEILLCVFLVLCAVAYVWRPAPPKPVQITHRLETRVNQLPPLVLWTNRNRNNLRRVLVQQGHHLIDIQLIDHTLYDGIAVAEKIVSHTRKRLPFFTLTLLDKETFQPVKTYDLLKCKTIKMLATGYYIGDPMVPSDTTYLGYKLKRGHVAVDPKVIPLRSRLYIPGYGYAYASDTGSAIKGLRIDLAVKDKHEEARYNHRRVTIYVLEKARTW